MFLLGTSQTTHQSHTLRVSEFLTSKPCFQPLTLPCSWAKHLALRGPLLDRTFSAQSSRVAACLPQVNNELWDTRGLCWRWLGASIVPPSTNQPSSFCRCSSPH